MRKFSVTKLNICVSVLHQIITAVCGLLLSRVILSSFGSENNGLMQSVTQILGYAVLLEGGIGGVMRAALYKPLAENDSQRISDIFQAGRAFFHKISLVFIALVVLLALCMKLAISTYFDWLYVFAIVLILGANTYFGYYSAILHKMLLMADQKLYIIQLFQIINTVINLPLCIVSIKLGAGIHIVKLITLCTAMLGPIFFCTYVNKHYSISKSPKKSNYKLPQRRDGVIHHLAYFVHRNTDVVILSLFTNLKNVSIYAVYHTVISVLEQLLSSISLGISSKIGNLLARKETDELNKTVDLYESCNAALTFSVGVVCYILILPFVSIYTSGVSDANYHQPLFAALLIGSSMIHCLMMPYSITISAAGHYKETKPGAIGEVSINLLLSLVLVRPLGIVGVAIGTLTAMLFRLLYNVWHLSKSILMRPKRKVVRCLLPNIVLSAVIIIISSMLGKVNASNIATLFVSAIIISVIVFPLFIALNALLQPQMIKILKKDK